MSCFDILYSVNLILQPILVDIDDTALYAIGNQATCNLTGCLHQMGFGGFIYYGMLSFYFLFSVRMGKSQDWIAKKAEPYMHGFAIVFPITTGLVGVIVDCYSYLDLYIGCWVANYPKGCQFPGAEECTSERIGYVYGGSLFFILIPSLIINNTLVYLHVRKVYRKWTPPPEPRSELSQRMWVSRSMTLDDASERIETTNMRRSRSTMTGSMDNGFRQEQRLRQVGTQATLYVVAAFLTYLPLIINELVLVVVLGYYREWQTQLFWFMCLQQTLIGLSGFWNAFIFFRPIYLAKRRNKLSPWQAIKHTLLARPASGVTAGSTRSFHLTRDNGQQHRKHGSSFQLGSERNLKAPATNPEDQASKNKEIDNEAGGLCLESRNQSNHSVIADDNMQPENDTLPQASAADELCTTVGNTPDDSGTGVEDTSAEDA